MRRMLTGVFGAVLGLAMPAYAATVGGQLDSAEIGALGFVQPGKTPAKAAVQQVEVARLACAPRALLAHVGDEIELRNGSLYALSFRLLEENGAPVADTALRVEPGKSAKLKLTRTGRLSLAAVEFAHLTLELAVFEPTSVLVNMPPDAQGVFGGTLQAGSWTVLAYDKGWREAKDLKVPEGEAPLRLDVGVGAESALVVTAKAGETPPVSASPKAAPAQMEEKPAGKAAPASKDAAPVKPAKARKEAAKAAPKPAAEKKPAPAPSKPGSLMLIED